MAAPNNQIDLGSVELNGRDGDTARQAGEKYNTHVHQTTDVQAAIDGANTPSAGNVFVTETVLGDYALTNSLGLAAFEDMGTAIGELVQLEDVGGSPGLPAVDGSQLLNLPGGAISYSEVNVESVGDISTGGGTVDFSVVIPARGIIDAATFTKTLGDSTNLAALLYDGDPAIAGVLVSPIFGSAFSGFDLTSGPRYGPTVSAGGSNINCAIPYYIAGTPYIRLVNNDFSNTGRASLDIWVREIA